jgi:protein-tyrosine phosphatase
MNKIKVLFVCMGNICRSPTGQGVFEHLVEQAALTDQIEIDSAGTHAYHVDEPPDSRATKVALKRGIRLAGQKARRVSSADFVQFDYILAMDSSNLRDLLANCPDEHQHKVKLLLSFASGFKEQDVPDPYYGGTTGFERVLDMVEEGARELLVDIRSRLAR